MHFKDRFRIWMMKVDHSSKCYIANAKGRIFWGWRANPGAIGSMYSPRVLLLTTVPYHTSYTLGVLSYSAPFQYLFLKNVSQSRGGGGGAAGGGGSGWKGRCGEGGGGSCKSTCSDPLMDPLLGVILCWLTNDNTQTHMLLLFLPQSLFFIPIFTFATFV